MKSSEYVYCFMNPGFMESVAFNHLLYVKLLIKTYCMHLEWDAIEVPMGVMAVVLMLFFSLE